MEEDYKERHIFLEFFEIIFSFIFTNLITLITFIIFPVTLIGTMHTVREIFFLRETKFILITYSKFVKKNFIKSFIVVTPLIVFTIVLLASLFYYNNILEEYGVTNIFAGILVLLQLFFTYFVVNIILINSIQMSVNSDKKSSVIYRDSFLFVSLNPIRCLLAFVSVFGVCTLSATVLSMYSLLVVVPIALSGYYLVLMPKFELMFDQSSGIMTGLK